MKSLKLFIVGAVIVPMIGFGAAAMIGKLENRVVPMTETAAGCSATLAFTGGGVWRLVDVLSTATNGSLTVDISTGVTGTDNATVTRRVGTLAVYAATNRVLSAGTSDYIWSGQSLVFSTATNNAGTHKLFVTLERFSE